MAFIRKKQTSCGTVCQVVESRRDGDKVRQKDLPAPSINSKQKLPTLRGKVLACWRCDWPGHGEPTKPCLAVVLARMADGVKRGDLLKFG